MNGDEPAVEIRGLVKQFGKSMVLGGVDLPIRRGTTLGLLGPNGAGKSTTLRILMGSLRPTAGAISVLGHDVLLSSTNVKHRIGYVPDANYAYRWMTVGRVIDFCRPMYQRWNDDRCEELLDAFQLPTRAKIGSLSKGMLAKLSLLLALAHEPELLVLDEPMSGLDPIARDDFIEGILRGICSGTQTVLFSSHQLDEVNRLADEVAIMNRGRILIHESLEDLLSRCKRVRAVLIDGRLPSKPPHGMIWQNVNRRQWTLTIRDCNDELLERLKADNPVQDVDVSSISLDELFRDVIRGDNMIDAGERTVLAC